MANWWDGHPAERFWCEITERPDVGRFLECPRVDSLGHPWWSFDFIRLVRPGDVVFHVSPAEGRIVGASLAGAPCTEEEILWPRRSDSILDPRVLGHDRVPGWRRPLRNHRPLSVPLTTDMIRADLAREWHSEWWEGRRLPGLLPIASQLFPRRAPSALGYLLKVPAGLAARWPALGELVREVERDHAAAGAA